ncbi:MAG: hypothetical protein ACRDQC_07275, partial [Gaiellales bacterium]
IERLTGSPKAGTAALDSFMQGVHAALLTAGGLTFIAALVAWIGLRGVNVRGPEGAPADPATTAMVEAA